MFIKNLLTMNVIKIDLQEWLTIKLDPNRKFSFMLFKFYPFSSSSLSLSNIFLNYLYTSTYHRTKANSESLEQSSRFNLHRPQLRSSVTHKAPSALPKRTQPVPQLLSTLSPCSRVYREQNVSQSSGCNSRTQKSLFSRRRFVSRESEHFRRSFRRGEPRQFRIRALPRANVTHRGFLPADCCTSWLSRQSMQSQRTREQLSVSIRGRSEAKRSRKELKASALRAQVPHCQGSAVAPRTWCKCKYLNTGVVRMQTIRRVFWMLGPKVYRFVDELGLPRFPGSLDRSPIADITP